MRSSARAMARSRSRRREAARDPPSCRLLRPAAVIQWSRRRTRLPGRKRPPAPGNATPLIDDVDNAHRPRPSRRRSRRRSGHLGERGALRRPFLHPLPAGDFGAGACASTSRCLGWPGRPDRPREINIIGTATGRARPGGRSSFSLDAAGDADRPAGGGMAEPVRVDAMTRLLLPTARPRAGAGATFRRCPAGRARADRPRPGDIPWIDCDREGRFCCSSTASSIRRAADPDDVAIGPSAVTAHDHPLARLAGRTGWPLTLGRDHAPPGLVQIVQSRPAPPTISPPSCARRRCAASMVETYIGEGWTNRLTPGSRSPRARG